MNPLDRLVCAIAPVHGLRRLNARRAIDMVRHYEGAAMGRRTDGWRTPATSADTSMDNALGRIRDRSRDLVRNDAWFSHAVRVVTSAVVGTGFAPRFSGPEAAVAKTLELWRRWAETTACDADGRQNIYGLQRLAMRTIVESGSVLIRHRPRLKGDGLPAPLRLQLMEPDHLDATRDTLAIAPNGDGSRVRRGIRFNALGERVGYNLFRAHPGDAQQTSFESVEIPAERVIHAFDVLRVGQVDGVPWGAPSLIRCRDLKDAADANLQRFKIASCFVGFVKDVDVDPDAKTREANGRARSQMFEPGTWEYLEPGKEITFGTPPTVEGMPDHMAMELRAIAKTFGITYEFLTGDFTRSNFSASRAAHLQMLSNIEDWRWLLFEVQVLQPLWAWFVQVAELVGVPASKVTVEWRPPRAMLMDPQKEAEADKTAVRAGLKTPSQALLERGEDPDAFWKRYADDIARMKKHGLNVEMLPTPAPDAGSTDNARGGPRAIAA